MADADLITVSQYLAFSGINPSDATTEELAQYAVVITAASKIVREYCDRDFTLTSDETIANPRQYRFYGHNILEIDDCNSINSVSTVALPSQPWITARTLDPSEYFAMPIGDPVLTYIEMWTVFRLDSPAMGFRNNLDTLGFIPVPIIIAVDATWGWTEIPTDIQYATFLVSVGLADSPGPYVAQAIANYSYSKALRGGLPDTDVVSNRIKSILDPYVRVNA